MKLVLRGLLLLLVLALLWYVSQAIASESGEVVVLTTHADDGPHTTRLWIVDHDGSAWLRSGSTESSWYRRLVVRPDIEVERDGKTASYTARPEAERRDEINPLMQQKYGWADSYIGFWFGRDDSIPIRLVPR